MQDPGRITADVQFPDTDYINRLEKKLQRLTGPQAEGNIKGKHLIDQLAQVKQHQAEQILLETPSNTTTFVASDSLPPPNPIVHRLFPERSALTREELELLLQSDVLDIQKSQLADFDAPGLEQFAEVSIGDRREPEGSDPWSNGGEPAAATTTVEKSFEDNFVVDSDLKLR